MQHGGNSIRTKQRKDYFEKHAILDNPSIPMVISRSKKRNDLIPNRAQNQRQRKTPRSLYIINTNFVGRVFLRRSGTLCSFSRQGKIANQGCCIHTYNTIHTALEHCRSLLSFLSSDSDHFADSEPEMTERRKVHISFPFFPFIDHDTTLPTPMHIKQQK